MAPVPTYQDPASQSSVSESYSWASSKMQHRRKRVKLSADSSDPSISDSSALVPTSVPSESTDASDIDSDSSSELSESSDEPSSESSSEDASDESELEENEDADGIVNLRAHRGKKPKMKLEKEELGPDIRGFLKDFLPQLKTANEELEEQRKAGTLKQREIEREEGVDGDEQYVEMDLGLGVLEAKDPNAEESSDSESDNDDGGEKDILGKLIGREKKDVGIQEVHSEPKT